MPRAALDSPPRKSRVNRALEQWPCGGAGPEAGVITRSREDAVRVGSAQSHPRAREPLTHTPTPRNADSNPPVLHCAMETTRRCCREGLAKMNQPHVRGWLVGWIIMLSRLKRNTMPGWMYSALSAPRGVAGSERLVGEEVRSRVRSILLCPNGFATATPQSNPPLCVQAKGWRSPRPSARPARSGSEVCRPRRC